MKKTQGAQIASSTTTPGALHKTNRKRLKSKQSVTSSSRRFLLLTFLVLTALLPSASGSPFFFDLLLSPFRSKPSYQRPSYTPQPSYNQGGVTTGSGGFKLPSLPSLPSNGPFNFKLPRLPALPDIGGPIKSFISGLTGGNNNNKPSYKPSSTSTWTSPSSGSWPSSPNSPDSSYGPPSNTNVPQQQRPTGQVGQGQWVTRPNPVTATLPSYNPSGGQQWVTRPVVTASPSNPAVTALPSYNPGGQATQWVTPAKPSYKPGSSQTQWVSRPSSNGQNTQWVTSSQTTSNNPWPSNNNNRPWSSRPPQTPRPPINPLLPTHQTPLGPFDNHGPGCDCNGPWDTVAPPTDAPPQLVPPLDEQQSGAGQFDTETVEITTYSPATEIPLPTYPAPQDDMIDSVVDAMAADYEDFATTTQAPSAEEEEYEEEGSGEDQVLEEETRSSKQIVSPEERARIMDQLIEMARSVARKRARQKAKQRKMKMMKEREELLRQGENRVRQFDNQDATFENLKESEPSDDDTIWHVNPFRSAHDPKKQLEVTTIRFPADKFLEEALTKPVTTPSPPPVVRPLVFMPGQLPRNPKSSTEESSTQSTLDRSLGSLVTLATLTENDMKEMDSSANDDKGTMHEKKMEAMREMVMKFINVTKPKDDFRTIIVRPFPNSIGANGRLTVKPETQSSTEIPPTATTELSPPTATAVWMSNMADGKKEKDSMGQEKPATPHEKKMEAMRNMMMKFVNSTEEEGHAEPETSHDEDLDDPEPEFQPEAPKNPDPFKSFMDIFKTTPLPFVSTEATPSDDPTDEPVEEEVTTGSKSDKLTFFQKLFGIQNKHSGGPKTRYKTLHPHNTTPTNITPPHRNINTTPLPVITDKDFTILTDKWFSHGANALTTTLRPNHLKPHSFAARPPGGPTRMRKKRPKSLKEDSRVILIKPAGPTTPTPFESLMILPKENLNMTMEILGEVSPETIMIVPDNASMTMEILDEVKDKEIPPPPPTQQEAEQSQVFMTATESPMYEYYDEEDGSGSGDYYEYYEEDEEYEDVGQQMAFQSETATVRPMFSKSLPKAQDQNSVEDYYDYIDEDTFNQSPQLTSVEDIPNGWSLMRPDLANVWQPLSRVEPEHNAGPGDPRVLYQDQQRQQQNMVDPSRRATSYSLSDGSLNVIDHNGASSQVVDLYPETLYPSGRPPSALYPEGPSLYPSSPTPTYPTLYPSGPPSNALFLPEETPANNDVVQLTPLPVRSSSGDSSDPRVRHIDPSQLLVYYPLSGRPFLSFPPSKEFSSIVKKRQTAENGRL